MRSVLVLPRQRLILISAALLVLCGTTRAAMAVDSWLTIYETSGDYWFYNLDHVETLTFDDTALLVTTNGVDRYELSMVIRLDFDLDSATVGVDGPWDPPRRPETLHLSQNHPNPFAPETHIAFELPRAGRAELRVYDASGRLIRTLLDEKRPRGRHTLSWDGRDDCGRRVPSGVYFYWLGAAGVDETRKMILVK